MSKSNVTALFSKLEATCANTHSLEDLVSVMNEEGVFGLTAEEQNVLAAIYAYTAAKDAGYGLTEENFEGHLECLADAGAKFDTTQALRLAEDYKVFVAEGEDF